MRIPMASISITNFVLAMHAAEADAGVDGFFPDAAPVEPDASAHGAHHGVVGLCVLHGVQADEAGAVLLWSGRHGLLGAVLPAEGPGDGRWWVRRGEKCRVLPWPWRGGRRRCEGAPDPVRALAVAVAGCWEASLGFTLAGRRGLEKTVKIPRLLNR